MVWHNTVTMAINAHYSVRKTIIQMTQLHQHYHKSNKIKTLYIHDTNKFCPDNGWLIFNSEYINKLT